MKKYILTFGILTGLIVNSQAQLNFDFNNRHLPQSSLANPAFLPQYKFNMGFRSTNAFSLSNFNLNTFFNKNISDSQSIANALKLNSSQFGVEFTSATELFNFGIRSKKAYFGFNSSIQNEGAFYFPKDLLGLAFFGNAQYIGKTAQLDFGGTQFTSYLKNQITYGRQLSNELSVGVNLAYLNGISNFAINKGFVNITTDTGVGSIYQISMESEIDAQSSMLGLDPTQFSDSTYKTTMNTIISNGMRDVMSLKSNRGFSADIGAIYRLNEKIRISASVQNLGFINWDKGAMTHTMPKSSWNFSGIDTSQFKQMQKNDSNDIFTQIQDTFNSKFNRNSTMVSSYQTSLKPRYTIGLEFFLFPRTNVQLMLGTGYGVLGNKSFVAAGVHQEIGEIIDLRASYAVYDFNFPQHRLGVGASFNLGVIQPFFNISDVLGAVNYGSANTVAGSFGFNFMIGIQKDKDNDGVPDKRDSCNKVFGVISNNGCPYGFLGESMNNENELNNEQPVFEIVPADSVSDPSKAKAAAKAIKSEKESNQTPVVNANDHVSNTNEQIEKANLTNAVLPSSTTPVQEQSSNEAAPKTVVDKSKALKSDKKSGKYHSDIIEMTNIMKK